MDYSNERFHPASAQESIDPYTTAEPTSTSFPGSSTNSTTDELNTTIFPESVALFAQHSNPTEPGNACREHPGSSSVDFHAQCSIESNSTIDEELNSARLPELVARFAQHSFTPEPDNACQEVVIPLKKWILSEVDDQVKIKPHQDRSMQQKMSMLRRTNVAYGIAELLRYMIKTAPYHAITPSTIHKSCVTRNFVVRLLKMPSEGYYEKNLMEEHYSVEPGWEVAGVSMISPPLSVELIAPSFSGSDVFEEEGKDKMGKNVQVEILHDLPVWEDQTDNIGQKDELMLCHLFGVILYVLFSQSGELEQAEVHTRSSRTAHNENDQGANKKNFSDHFSSNNANDNGEEPHPSPYAPLNERGCSSSVWSLVQNLLDCGWGDFRPNDSYASLEVVCKDIHLLLSDPEHFLFDYYEYIGAANPSVDGRMPLQISKDNLYGRKEESTLISDAFCRVASSGESEALFIGGYSGSGKSRLVRALFVPVTIAGGYVVTQKFDEISKQSPLSLVVSTFNDLCAVVKERSTEEDLFAIEAELVRVFGNNLSMLARILPNIIELIQPQTVTSCISSEVDIFDINFNGLCFIVQNVMRVLSKKSRPVMLFLDDLQWADDASLGVIHAVLSDLKGSSCLFFVGSYRDNEVKEGHFIFPFVDKLESFNVQSTKLHLHGMNADDLNAMISDALCIFPRLCKTLSAAIYHKTQGNPLFALEFLHSLVGRDLVQYSFRERRWVWDESKIRAEEISDSVLELLTTKMTALSADLQKALSTAACFGTQLNSAEVDFLNATPQYAGFKKELDQAAHDGFVEYDKSSYKFVHDKVREAAYGLISSDERDQFHYNIGMALYTSSKGREDDILFSIVDQINLGIPFVLNSSSLELFIAELNLKAGTRAISCSNFLSAYSYLNVGVSLLPDGSWDSHYDLSLNLFLSLAKVAHSFGRIDDASEASNVVLEKGRNLEDKVDAYLLSISVLHSTRQDVFNAFAIARKVLGLLGENIPDQVDQEDFFVLVHKIQRTFSKQSDNDLLSMKKTSNKTHISIMQFYDQLLLAAYYAKPKDVHYYACRWAEFTLKNGLCKYTASTFAQFACTLCSNLVLDTAGAYRIGKLALALLNRFDATDMIPRVYLCFYGYVAILTEPFQSCADMLTKGYEVGMSIGNTTIALLNRMHMVPKAMFSGMNLAVLKAEIDSQLKLISCHSQSTLETYMLIYQETIALLKGDGVTNSQKIETELLGAKNGSISSDYSESLFLQRLVSSYWCGRFERARYFAERWLPANDEYLKLKEKFRSIMILFYYGLTASRLFRTKKHRILKTIVAKSIYAMENAAEFSKWNFQNKVLLLEAERFSMENQEAQAQKTYDGAIAAARDSKFIHEQGLACELAGLHYKYIGNKNSALELFEQAKQCYFDWGSQMKVDYIGHQINILAGGNEADQERTYSTTHNN